MPEIRRFITRDEYRGEASEPISMHRYAYCGNDPINYVEPMGTYQVAVSINGGGGGYSSLGKDYQPKPPTPEHTSQASRQSNTSSTNRSTSSNTSTRTTTSTQRTNSSPPKPEPAKTSGSSLPSESTFWDNLSQGTYFGTQHGEDRSEEHTSELQSRPHLVCRLLLEKKNKNNNKRVEIPN